MSIKNIARACCQGGHNPHFNLRVKAHRRRTRRAEKRFVQALLVNSESDAQISVKSPRWRYEEMGDTGRDGPLVRWLTAMVGHDFDEAYHRLSRADRRSKAGHAFMKRVRRQFDWEHNDATAVWHDDIVVDRCGTLCRGDDYESQRVGNHRPWVRWSFRRKVVDRCGDLFWKEDDGTLVPFSQEATEQFHLLSGNQQRRIKGYYRSMDGKRRLSRELPSVKRWRARQIALGRPVLF